MELKGTTLRVFCEEVGNRHHLEHIDTAVVSKCADVSVCVKVYIHGGKAAVVAGWQLLEGIDS